MDVTGLSGAATPASSEHRPMSTAHRPALAVLLVAAFALAAVACAKEEPKTTTGGEGYVVELASEIGPHAFTPPVDTPAAAQDPSLPSCDKQDFIKELQSRPDAIKEWAKVLQIPESSVPAYVNTLQPATLAADLKVTNHGLKDGRAYPRASILTSGTAVLVDPTYGAKHDVEGPAATYVPTSTTSSSLATTTSLQTQGTAYPSTAYPVTRCKCGNPLLPPPPPGTPPPVNGTFPPGTYTPGSQPSGSTQPTAPGTTGRSTQSTSSSASSTSSSIRQSSSSSSPSSSSPPSSKVVTSSSQPVSPQGTR